MDSLPLSLPNSGPLISLELLSGGKGDNISMMSSDSLQLDMGELHSADALDQLPSADAADVKEIIATGLKDVDCSKVDGTEATSIEMEFLSINDEDYNELMEERRRQKLNSMGSLPFQDDLTNQIVEDKSSVKEKETGLAGADDLIVKGDGSGKNENITNNVTNDLTEIRKDVYMLPNVYQDLELEAINQIISSVPGGERSCEKSALCSSGINECAAVSSSDTQDNGSSVVRSESPSQLINDVRPEVGGDDGVEDTASFSSKQQEEKETPGRKMFVLDHDQDSNEANSPGEPVASETTLRDRGGSSRSKPSKFASSNSPLRHILPKTVIPTSGGASITSATMLLGTVGNMTQSPCLNSAIPSVVQEAIDLGVDTDGPIQPHQESYILPPPEPIYQPLPGDGRHNQQPVMCLQQSGAVLSNTVTTGNPYQQRHQLIGEYDYGMAPGSGVTMTTTSYRTLQSQQEYTQPHQQQQNLLQQSLQQQNLQQQNLQQQYQQSRESPRHLPSHSHNAPMGHSYSASSTNPLPHGIPLPCNAANQDMGGLYMGVHQRHEMQPEASSSQQFVIPNTSFLQYHNQISTSSAALNQFNLTHPHHNDLSTSHPFKLDNLRNVSLCQSNMEETGETASFYDRMMSGEDNSHLETEVTTLGQKQQQKLVQLVQSGDYMTTHQKLKLSSQRGKNKAPKRLTNHKHLQSSTKILNGCSSVSSRVNTLPFSLSSESKASSALLSHNECLNSSSNTIAPSCKAIDVHVNREIEAIKLRLQLRNENSALSAIRTDPDNFDLGSLSELGNSHGIAAVTSDSGGVRTQNFGQLCNLPPEGLLLQQQQQQQKQLQPQLLQQQLPKQLQQQPPQQLQLQNLGEGYGAAKDADGNVTSDDIHFFGDLNLDFSEYLGSSDKMSNGSGGSGGKYINSEINTVNGNQAGSQPRGEIEKLSYSDVNQVMLEKSRKSQLPVEKGSIDVNAWRQGNALTCYSNAIVTTKNPSHVQNVDHQHENLMYALARQNNEPLSSQTLPIYNRDYHLTIPNERSNAMVAKLPVAGSNFELNGGLGVEDLNEQSRISDVSMHSTEGSLNNLSRADVNAPGNKQVAGVSRNVDFNNTHTLNIVASAPSYDKSRAYKDKDIGYFPPQGRMKDKWCPPQHEKNTTRSKHTSSSSPSSSQTVTSQLRICQQKKPSSSSSSSVTGEVSGARKKGRVRHGLSRESVAGWVSGTSGRSCGGGGGGGGGGGLTGDLLPPSCTPQQDFLPQPQQYQHSTNGHGVLPQQPPQLPKQQLQQQTTYHHHNLSYQQHQQEQLLLQQQRRPQQRQQLLRENLQQQHPFQGNGCNNSNGNNDSDVNIPPGLPHDIGQGRHLVQNQLPQMTPVSSTSTILQPPYQYSQHHHQQQHRQQRNPSAPVTPRGSAQPSKQPSQSHLTSPKSIKSSALTDLVATNNSHPSPSNILDPQNPNRATANQSVDQRFGVGQQQTVSLVSIPTTCSPEESLSMGAYASYPSNEFLSNRELSSIGSSHSSMESKRRWLESLGVDDEEETPLHCLCDMPEDEGFYRQLRENKNFSKVIDHVNNQQQTALFVAVIRRKARVVQFLVDNGADANILCKSDPKAHSRGTVEFQTALHEAVESWDAPITKLLLTDESTDVDSRRQHSQMTPLMLALSNHSPPSKDNINIIAMLLSYRASLKVQDADGLTPLMYMVKSGDLRLVSRVFKIEGVAAARALVTVTTRKTLMTCLHYATALKEKKVDRERKMDLMKLLIEHGADPNKLNADKQSPRHLASSEISMVMGQLKTKSVRTDGSCSSDSPRNSPICSPAYKPGDED